MVMVFPSSNRTVTKTDLIKQHLRKNKMFIARGDRDIIQASKGGRLSEGQYVGRLMEMEVVW